MDELPQHPNWEIDNSQAQTLDASEVEQRVWKAVDELEEVINLFNKTIGKRDEARRAALASAFRVLLAEKYGIVPPTEERTDPERS